MKKELEMADEKEKEQSSKSVSIFIDGAKILLPFAVAIASVVMVSTDASKERALLQQQLNVNDRADVARELRVHQLEKVSNERAVVLARFDVKLTNIENDTKETLELVRDLRRVN